MIALFLLVVLLIVAGGVWFHGLGSNAITLINVILAALIATNFFEPITAWIDTQSGAHAYTYLSDFLTLWLVFVVAFSLLRLLTDQFTSTQRIVFPRPVEMGGRTVLALLIGWVFMSFTCMTLHTAPLQAEPFGGAFASPTQASFVGLSPDKQWLQFVNLLSQGSLNNGQPFDPQFQFIAKYHKRRSDFEKVDGFLVNR